MRQARLSVAVAIGEQHGRTVRRKVEIAEIGSVRERAATELPY